MNMVLAFLWTGPERCSCIKQPGSGAVYWKKHINAVHMAHLEYGDVAKGGGEQIACAVAAGSCPQAPQEYDRLVRLLLCLYTERGSATARRALAALLQDERRMNDEAIP